MKKIFKNMNIWKGITVAVAIVIFSFVANDAAEFNAMNIALIIYITCELIFDIAITIKNVMYGKDSITITLTGDNKDKTAETMFKSVYDGTEDVFIEGEKVNKSAK